MQASHEIEVKDRHRNGTQQIMGGVWHGRSWAGRCDSSTEPARLSTTAPRLKEALSSGDAGGRVGSYNGGGVRVGLNSSLTAPMHPRVRLWLKGSTELFGPGGSVQFEHRSDSLSPRPRDPTGSSRSTCGSHRPSQAVESCSTCYCYWQCQSGGEEGGVQQMS